MLKLLRTGLEAFPIDLSAKLNQHLNEAAVLITLCDSEDPKVILTLRAKHLRSHAGQVALPGGKRDNVDANLLQTALRECQEEIALGAHQVEIFAQLPTLTSRFGIAVTPFVAYASEDLQLQANPDEIDAIFHVPLSFFLADQRLRTDRVSLKGREYHVPAYEYDGFEIWGLTAAILIDMLNTGLDAGIPIVDVHRHNNGQYP